MKISLESVSKRYQRHWVFKGVSGIYEPAGRYAILGKNGSGKSTLLRIIAGMQPPSAGKLLYDGNGTRIEPAEVFRHISFCAPGMELPEELTLEEFLDFHFTYKRLRPGFSIQSVIEATGLGRAAYKPIGDYSSGMKQRVKLAQAFFADTPAILLDEPCTNLDEAGVQQYLDWIEAYTKGRTVIVASNDTREYAFCEYRMLMSDYQ
jgi:ABC-type multidrug transport system ATPase subunit